MGEKEIGVGAVMGDSEVIEAGHGESGVAAPQDTTSRVTVGGMVRRVPEGQ